MTSCTQALTLGWHLEATWQLERGYGKQAVQQAVANTFGPKESIEAWTTFPTIAPIPGVIFHKNYRLIHIGRLLRRAHAGLLDNFPLMCTWAAIHIACNQLHPRLSQVTYYATIACTCISPFGEVMAQDTYYGLEHHFPDLEAIALVLLGYSALTHLKAVPRTKETLAACVLANVASGYSTYILWIRPAYSAFISR